MIKLIIFCLILLFSLTILMVPSQGWVETAFIKSGYYFTFVSLMLWLIFLLRIRPWALYSFMKKHSQGFILSICAAVMIFTISPPRFKILGDETTLLGTSMAIYKDKTSHVPLYGMDYQKSTFSVCKRPLLYPFLTSIIHSFTGYKATNAFVVNFISSICTLFLFYLFLSFYFSKKLGLISILLVAGSPIFTFWSTSGGFESINLTFLMFVFLFLCQFLKIKNIIFFTLLILTLILLAQCRYESIIFFLPLLILIPVFLRDKLFYKSSWVTVFSPIFLIPVFWQRRLDSIQLFQPNDYFAAKISDMLSAFNLKNFFNNSIDNIYVLTGFDPSYGFSPVITLLAIIGIYFLIRKIIISQENIAWDIKQILMFCVISIILLVAIHFSYFWGNFSNAASNRFALIYLPFLIFPAIYAIHKIEKILFFSKSIFPIFFIFHLIFFLPYSADQNKIKTLIAPIEYEKTLEYLKKNYGENDKESMLIITENPEYYIVQGYGALSFQIANKREKEVKKRLKKILNRVIIIQKYDYLYNSPFVKTRLDQAFKYHKVGIIKISPNLFLKISELDIII